MTTIRAAVNVAALFAVLTLAVGCGSSQPSSSGPTPDQPPTIGTGAPPPRTDVTTPAPDPLTATPPPGTTALPVARVDAESLPAGFPTLVWTRGPRTVGVYGRAGGCLEVHAEVGEQTADRVVVRVVQATTGPGPCTRELRYVPLEVPLQADLGDRRVVLVAGR